MYKHILIPIDGSAKSDDALECGINWAKTVGAKVTLLHVVPRIPLYAKYDYSGVAYTAFLDELEKFGAQLLVLAEDQYADTGVSINTKLRQGNPSEEICQEAEEGDCDLIVMGSRGLGEVKGFLLGSVSGKVVRHAHIPVLIVK